MGGRYLKGTRLYVKSRLFDFVRFLRTYQRRISNASFMFRNITVILYIKDKNPSALLILKRLISIICSDINCILVNKHYLIILRILCVGSRFNSDGRSFIKDVILSKSSN